MGTPSISCAKNWPKKALFSRCYVHFKWFGLECGSAAQANPCNSGPPPQIRPKYYHGEKEVLFRRFSWLFWHFFASSSALCMLDSSSAKRISFIFHAGALFYKFCTLGWFVEQGLFCGTAFQTKPLQMDITCQKRAFSWVFSENFSPFVLPIVLRFGYLCTYFF